MSTARVPMAERKQYRVEVEQPTIDELRIVVTAPDGRRAQWEVKAIRRERWVIDRVTRESRREDYVEAYTLLGRRYADYDKATRAAMLRARHWLGSCWGLRGPARRLP